jgi:integrase
LAYVKDLGKNRPRRWQANYRGPDGRERAKAFVRRAEAEAFLSTVEASLYRGDWVDPQKAALKFDDWANEWLAACAHLRPNSYSGYRGILSKHLRPRFGARPVGTIQTSDARRLVRELGADGLAPGTIRNTLAVFRMVLDLAVDDGAIAKNPCTVKSRSRRVQLPKSRHEEMHFLNPVEVQRLAEAVGPKYRTLIYFAAYTGLRAREITALKVSRLHLDPGNVEVVEAGDAEIGPTKNWETRTVGLPRFLVEMLASELTDRGAVGSDFVFTSPRGLRVLHNNFYRRVFREAVDETDLPSNLRFHDLRHTCAALLISQGAHARAIKEHLGHSSISVTMDRYGHLFPDERERLVVALDAAYRTGLESSRGLLADS